MRSTTILRTDTVYRSHPTVGVAIFGSNVEERLSSSREEFQVSVIILPVQQYKILKTTKHIKILVALRERISSKSCFGSDIELVMWGVQKNILHPYRGMTLTRIEGGVKHAWRSRYFDLNSRSRSTPRTPDLRFPKRKIMKKLVILIPISATAIYVRVLLDLTATVRSVLLGGESRPRPNPKVGSSLFTARYRNNSPTNFRRAEPT